MHLHRQCVWYNMVLDSSTYVKQFIKHFLVISTHALAIALLQAARGGDLLLQPVVLCLESSYQPTLVYTKYSTDVTMADSVVVDSWCQLRLLRVCR